MRSFIYVLPLSWMSPDFGQIRARGECPLRLAGRHRAAAGDGLALVGAGERYYREHRGQCHEQAQYSFAHCLLLFPGIRCRLERSRAGLFAGRRA
jgi:hypothetical protein